MQEPFSFSQARERQLQKLDGLYAELRKIIADPEWCNDIFPGFVKASREIAETIQDLRSLNTVECQARDLMEEPNPKS